MTVEMKLARPAGLKAEGVMAAGPAFYKLAGAAALMVVATGILDTAISFLPAGVTPEPGQGAALDWFTLLRGNWFLGLRGLGLLNLFNLVLGVPVFLALYGLHSRACKTYAALALILASAGLAVYLSNNPALPMLGLSGKYAAAATPAQRSAIIATGEALLARGEDFTPGAFGGFVLGEIAGLVIAGVMLHGGIFGKAEGYLGLAGMGSMLIFTVWATFVPIFYGGAMVFAMAGGLLSVAWYLLIARRLFQFGRGTA